jgi:phenylalanyl-tRNA synthetase alpha chain
MKSEDFIKQRSKVPIKVFLEYFSNQEYNSLKNNNKIKILGKNKNIIGYSYNFQEITSKNLEIISKLPKYNFLNFVDDLKNILISLNFQEITKPVLTNEFFNFQMLNMDLRHPDRNIRDTFISDSLSICKDLDLSYKILEKHNIKLENTSLVRKNNQLYSPKSLRTHTTSIIFESYYNKESYTKSFNISQIFRRERQDLSHSIQFTQLEININKTNYKYQDFLSLITSILNKLGFQKIKFTPTKYPYTEPSFQVQVFWNARWLEIGGGGIFIPSLTQNFTKNLMFGFGFGCERLYMLTQGFNKLSEIDEI